MITQKQQIERTSGLACTYHNDVRYFRGRGAGVQQYSNGVAHHGNTGRKSNPKYSRRENLMLHDCFSGHDIPYRMYTPPPCHFTTTLAQHLRLGSQDLFICQCHTHKAEYYTVLCPMCTCSLLAYTFSRSQWRCYV